MSRPGIIDHQPADTVRARPLSDWDNVVREEEDSSVTLAGPVIVGMLTLVLGVGGFFFWAANTPLAQASVASGKVVVESNTKTVTHLEGGTLDRLLVKDGDRVIEGQVLAMLDTTRSKAAFTRITEQLFAARIRMARLVAERDGLDNFAIDPAIKNDVSARIVAEVIANEKSMMAERANLHRDLLAADDSMIDQLNSQREALTARQASLTAQREVVQAEHDMFEGLLAKELTTRSQFNEKKLLLADVESRLSDVASQLSENLERKNQLELNRSNRKTDHFRLIAEALQATQHEIGQLVQEKVTAQDIVGKAAIRAPQAGIVANIRIRTTGSAVIPGQPLMDIVPANQPKIIEGKARAADIDSVRVGEKAEIRLSAFGAAEARPLVGEITYIAPDSLVDERTGEATYAFRAHIPAEELSKQPDLFLYPGMAAEVYIVNGNRTALAYLLSPIKKSFNKAFREQ